VASTQAALKYLNSLHKMLSQDWLLALAAYNYGPGNIRNALKQIKLASFWDLKRLPKETQNYVPKFLALAAIIKDPAKYNIQLPPATNNIRLTPVKVGAKVSLQDVAKSSGISAETMRELNPGYTTMTTDHDTPNTVLLPVDSSQVLEPQSIAVTAAVAPANKHANLFRAILQEGQWLAIRLTNIPQTNVI
jgi:membrane-bound lytic murein transglycosylase D